MFQTEVAIPNEN